MPILNLPDGKVLNIPTGISEAEANQLLNELAERYPEQYALTQERTPLGHLAEIGKGIPRGFLSGFASAGEGLANLFDTDNDNIISQGLRGFQDSLDESFLGTNEAYRDSYSAKLGQGLGSFATFFTPGLALKAAGLGGKTVAQIPELSKIAGVPFLGKTLRGAPRRVETLGAAAIAVPMGISEQGQRLEQARKEGEEVGTVREFISELGGAGIGLTELLPVERLLKGVRASSAMRFELLPALASALGQGVAEGGQEVLASVMQDAVARGLYNPNQEIAGSLWDELTVGGGVGAIADFFMSAIGGRRFSKNKMDEESLRNKQVEEKQAPAVKTQEDLMPNTSNLPVPIGDVINLQTDPNAIGQVLETLRIAGIGNPEAGLAVDYFSKVSADGMGFDVVNPDNNVVIGTYQTQEEASREAGRLRDQSYKNVLELEGNERLRMAGLQGSGSAQIMLNRMIDPDYSYIPVQTIANYDSEITDKQVQNARVVLGEIVRTEGRLPSKIIDPASSRARGAFEVFKERAAKKKLPVKGFYSPAEARELLDKQDFNELMDDMADTSDITRTFFVADLKRKVSPRVFRQTDSRFREWFRSQKIKTKDRPKVGTANIPQTVTKKMFVDLAAQKNILLDVNSSGFKQFLETYTGERSFKDLSAAQKRLAYAKLATIPTFAIGTTPTITSNAPMPFPNFDKRPYSFDQLNAVYQRSLTNPDRIVSPTTIARQTGLDKKSATRLFEDLVESGRLKPQFFPATKEVQYFTPQGRLFNTRGAPYRSNQGFLKTEAQLKVTRKPKYKGKWIPRNPEELSTEYTRDLTSKNETLEEYGARLTALGFSPEQVEQLVENERERQEQEARPIIVNVGGKAITEKALKHRQKIKDKKETMEDRKVSFTAAMNKVAKRLNVPNRVKINVVEDINKRGDFGSWSLVQKDFRDPTGEIILSVNAANPDGTLAEEEILERVSKTMNHETVHALRDLDLFTDREWMILSSFVKRAKISPLADEKGAQLGKTWFDKGKALYPDLTDVQQTEEAVALLFEEYAMNPEIVTGRPRTLMEKIADFFRSIIYGSSLAGFRSPIEIFQDIESGLIGGREVGEIRSLKELDRESAKQTVEGKVIVQAGGEEAVLEEAVAAKRAEPENLWLNPQQRRVKRETTYLADGIPEDILYSVYAENEKNPDGKQLQQGLINSLTTDRQKKKAEGYNIPDFETLRRKLSSALRQGADANWYRNFGMGVATKIGFANMHEFSALYAATSPKTEVTQNIQETLDVMRIAREIDPVEESKKFSKELDKVITFPYSTKKNAILNFYKRGYYTTVSKGTLKTPNYAETVLNMADNVFSPWAVMDSHMFELLGMPKEGATEREYRYAQGMIQLLASDQAYDVYDAEGNFVRTRKLEPHEAQAALWAYQRNGLEEGGALPDESDFDLAMRKNAKKMEQLQAVINRDAPLKDYFIQAPRPHYIGGESNNPYSTYDLDKQVYLSRLAMAPKVIIETKAGRSRKYMPEGLELSMDEWIDYHSRVKESIVDRDGQITFLRELGIPHTFEMGFGTYENELSPNFVLKLPTLDYAEAQDVGAILADAFMQDSVATGYMQPNGANRTLLISKPDDAAFTQEDLTEFNRRLEELRRATAWGDDVTVDYALMGSNQNMIVIGDPASWGVSSADYRSAKLGELAEMVLPIAETLGFNIKRSRLNTELINYEQEDTAGNPEYGYRSKVGQLRHRGSFPGTPNIQRAAIRDLYLPVWKTYQSLLKEQGAEPQDLIPPWEKAGNAVGSNLGVEIKIEEAVAEVENIVKGMARGTIPLWNTNASPLAIASAFNHIDAKLDQTSPEEWTAHDVIDNYELSPENDATFSRRVPDEIWDSEFSDLRTVIYGNPKEGEPIEVPDETPFQSMLKGVLNRDTFSERFESLRAKFVDNWASWERTSKEAQRVLGVTYLADLDAVAAIRFSDRARGIMARGLTRGVPAVIETEGGGSFVKVVPFVGTNGKEVGGLVQILAPLYKEQAANQKPMEKYFHAYAVVRRGTRLNKEGKATPVTENMKAQAKELARKYPVIKEVYDNYQKWNNELLDFAEKTGILNQEERMLWQDYSDYYPFYRYFPSDEKYKYRGPKLGSALVGESPFKKELTGSFAPINEDMLTALTRNSLSIVTRGMRNVALQRIMRDAVTIGSATPIDARDAKKGAPDIVYYQENGHGTERYFTVHDPALIKSMEAFGSSGLGNITKVLSMPAGWLRDLVTRSPDFILANLLRDTLSAYVTSGANMVPVVDTFKNFVGSREDMDTLADFGVVGGYDFSNDPENIAAYISKLLQKEGQSVLGGISVKDGVKKAWDWLGDITTKSDASTRMAAYDQVLKETSNEAEAAYQGMEIINFSRRGSSSLFRIYASAVPFLNARIQGLDVFYRSLKGEYSAYRGINTPGDITQKALARGGALLGMTALYYALVSDTDEYKNARREVRDDNWIIPYADGIPALKIPIPFEVGVIFKVFPERLMDNLMGESTIDDVYESYKRQLATSLNIPILEPSLGIQTLAPLVDAYINFDSYTRTDIVPYYMEEGQEAGYQSRYSTNELTRILGEAFNISPIKLEYVLRGYGGSLGSYALTVVDAMTRAFSDRDLIPQNIDRYPVMRRFFQSPQGGGLQQQFYELRTEVNKSVQTLNSLKKEKRMDEYRAYRETHADLLRLRTPILAIDRYMKNWRKRRDNVQRSKTIPPQKKKELLLQMEIERDRRLASVPALKKRADIPFADFGL